MSESLRQKFNEIMEGQPILVPSVIKYMSPSSYGRPVMMSGNIKGLFHCFIESDARSPDSIAIIELENGSCTYSRIGDFKFTDREKYNAGCCAPTLNPPTVNVEAVEVLCEATLKNKSIGDLQELKERISAIIYDKEKGLP